MVFLRKGAVMHGRLSTNYLRAMALLALAACTGCAVTGPGYQRPSVPMETAFRQPAPKGPSVADQDWWQVFRDPVLVELIRISLRENQDLERATQRVEELRATVGFTRADQLPQGTGSFSTSRSRASIGAPAALAAKAAGVRELDPINDDRLFAAISYDADIFGRLRRLTRAARLELFASAYARRAIGIALITDVAQSYLDLRDLDARLEIDRRTLEARRAALKLVTDRFTLGIGSEVEVVQSQRELELTAGDIPDLERQIAQKENQISELLGRPPGAIARGLALVDQPFAPEVPPGLPIQLLARRPDVRQAELELVAQNERIDIARTFRYPQLVLTSTAGFESTELHELLHEGNFAWSLLSNLTAPILTFGKNRRRVDIEKARYAELTAAYRSTILRALREVEDALVAIRRFAESLDHSERRTALSRKALELARLRYESGVASYLEVLDSQRELLLAELATSILRRSRLQAVVQLYRALGGGWPYEPPAMKCPEKLPQTAPPEPLAAAAKVTSERESIRTTSAGQGPPESD